MKKRIGAILLTICMLVGLLPTAALAAETTTESPWDLVTPDEYSTDQTPYYDDLMVNSFDDLANALATVPDDIQSGYEPTLTINVVNFTWPAEASELTIDFDGDQRATTSCVPKIMLWGNVTGTEGTVPTWDIPQNITITCYENLTVSTYCDAVRINVGGTLNLGSEIKDYREASEIIVNGTLNCMQNSALGTFSTITVNEGSSLIAYRCELAQNTVLDAGASMKVGQWVEVYDLTVHNGATFESTGSISWSLYGTLTLEDGVEVSAGTMEITTSSANNSGDINAVIVTDGSAVFDGTISLDAAWGATSALTLQGNLEVGPILVDTYRTSETESDWGYAEIIVPAGSHVKTQYINEDIYDAGSNLDINVAGTLEFAENGGTNSWKLGDLVLGETAEDGTVTKGTIIMGPYSHLFADYEDPENPVSSKITGNGTIKMYAKLDSSGEWGSYPGLFGYNSFDSETDPLYEAGYIADTVTIWRNWECDHNWDEGSVTTTATCTEDGNTTFTCSECGTTKTETIAATGHTEVTDAAVAPTCTATGLTEGKHCSACGEVLTAQETVAALGHAWNTDNCAEKATCTRENCGATRAAGEHAWGGWTVTTEATCTADGSQTRTCGSCGATESETIGKLGHDYQSVVTAPTCTDGGYTTHTCSRCGDSYTDSETTALGHDWDDGVITTEPTESADGVKTYTCSVCGGTKTEAVPKLAKQIVSWIEPGPIKRKYGEREMITNTAYNDSVENCTFIYSSSDENVAVMNEFGYAVIQGAGETTITATAPAVPGKYAETSASYTLIINKAPLTVTANNASITYGQAPANNGWTASGFVYDDTAADVVGTAAYTYGYEQFGKVGSYDIHVSGLTSDNYEITYAPGTLTVNKATEYTITLSNLSQRDDAVTDVTAAIAPQDTTAQITVEYLVNEAWTSEVPADAGEYQVRAALASSDNIAVNGAYTTGTLVIERSIVVDDTDVSVTVEGEKAEIVVTDEELTEIMNNVDGEVAIDLSGVTGVTELALPGDLMEALSESDKADGLTVTTGDAAITMSDAVLDTVAKELTGEDTVTVKLTAVEENELNGDQQAALDSITQDAVIVEVSLVITHADGSTTELHQLGGNVEVTVPYAGEVPEGKYIVVCYLSDDGNVTYVRATYDAEKKQVTFNTNHFSNYAIFVSGDPMVVVNGGSGSGLYPEGSTVTIKADSKSGYTFTGWEIVAGTVTLADSKKAETTFVMPGEAVELKATYRKNSSSGGGGGGSTAYAVSIENSKHGEVSADSKTFAKGETVTLTVNPDTGYTLETLTVTDKNGKELKLTKKDGKYTFTMPAGKVTVKATFTEDNSMLNFFVDVPADAYYYDAVLWAAENAITGGTSATTFSPDMTCTRAQAVTFLWRAAGSPAPESKIMPFADVSADAYYYDAVLWAVEQGITAGTSETTFSPDMKCTRAQIVTFLWRAQKTPAAEIVNPFTDVANDAYYADAVIWAVEQGITAGTSADTFSPNANCTRAQIVTFLWRCMGE